LKIFEERRKRAHKKNQTAHQSHLSQLQSPQSKKKQVEKLLNELREGKQLTDNTEEVASDVSLNLLNYQDFPTL
jgi:hypothetical protein